MASRLPLDRLEVLYERLQTLEGESRSAFLEGLDLNELEALQPFLTAEEEEASYFEAAKQALHPVSPGISSKTLGAGAMIGHFRLFESLRSGGMSTVYVAEDARLNRTVALKVVDLRGVSNYKDFLKEARMVASLEHDNICAIRSFGFTDDDKAYIEMPLYKGMSLRERLDQGPIPETDLLWIVAQTARGLEAAHQSGVVHRDIKPDNLFIEEGGRVRILDFGVARMMSKVPSTAMGVLKGTIPYVSPESISDPPALAVSDLWSLGVVIYEATAGKQPFQGPTIARIMDAILYDEPPKIEGASSTVKTLIDTCLVKNADDRIGSAGALLALIESMSAS